MRSSFIWPLLLKTTLNQRIPCTKDTDIKSLGNQLLLCQYSSLSNFSEDRFNKFWGDLSGNNNHLTDTHIIGVWRKEVLNDHIWETSIMNGARNKEGMTNQGYIIFPTECNLLKTGYTLFTVSMYYNSEELIKSGARIFGECNSTQFISGFDPSYQGSLEISAIHNNTQIGYIALLSDSL